jgi:hypothetical protein
MSDFPSRCQHIKVNGTQCGSPALRRYKFCFFHKRFQSERLALNQARARRRAATLDLPVLEDANSIQVSLMQIMRLLALGHLDSKTAGLMLYALQTASLNLHRTNFEPNMHHIVLDPKAVDETPLGAHVWDDEDFEDEDNEEAQREEAEAEAKQRDLERDAGLWRSMLEAEKRQRREERQRAEQDRQRQEADAQREAEVAALKQAESQPQQKSAYTKLLAEIDIRPKPAADAEASTIKDDPINTVRRPPRSVTVEEVREKVRNQIRAALPALAEALNKS